MILTFLKKYDIIYIGNEKGVNIMELWEAVKLLQEGKKVRKKSWSKSDYIYLDKDVGLMDNIGHIIPASIEKTLFADMFEPWEEYKEGWQNVEVKNIWDLPIGVVDMAQVTAASCPYCNKRVVTLRILGDCKYCPYCGKQVIK